VDSDVFIQILESKASNARLEEKLINIERYVLKDFRSKLAENASKTETRFKWMIGLFVTFMGISVTISTVLSGAI